MIHKQLTSARLLLAAIYLFLVPVASQAVPMQIQDGDSFRFYVDFTGATPEGPYSFLSWHINTAFSDGFNQGDSLSVALFDDADSGTALGTGEFNWNGLVPDFSYGSMIDSNPAFDGTGYLEFTMLSGSIDLTGGAVLIYDQFGPTANGLTDIELLSNAAVSVPEPNTLALLGLALVVLMFFSAKKNRSATFLRQYSSI